MNQYYSVSTTVATGTTDSAVSMSPVKKGKAIFVANDDATETNTISFKLNTTGDDGIVVRGGEAIEVTDADFSAVYLSNSSGSTIAYRLIVQGEA